MAKKDKIFRGSVIDLSYNSLLMNLLIPFFREKIKMFENRKTLTRETKCSICVGFNKIAKIIECISFLI